MGIEQQAGIFLFNFFMVIFTIPAWFVAKACLLAQVVKPMKPGCLREQIALVFTCMMWRMVIACSWWVRCDIEGLAEFRSRLGDTGRSAVIVSNHASFLDTILLVTFMPLAKQRKIKMFVSGHLKSMPIIGALTTAMGHKSVPFKATGADGTFELDRDLMAERQKELELHVAGGGFAGWFPEGTMNRGDVREIAMFRKGGFTLAVHVDVEIWCVGFNGNTDCWPRTAALGGRPSNVRGKIFRLCESSHQYVKEAKVDLSNDEAASTHLANSAQAQVQAAVKEICAEIQ